MKKHIFLLVLFAHIYATITCAQVLTFEGKVTDSLTEKGIPYVNIGFPAYSIGTSSNELGDFVIKIPQERRGDTLVFSSIGYVTLKIAVKAMIGQKSIRNIVLKPNTINLDEFVFKSIDANKTLTAFFKNRAKNYATKPAMLQYFCREALKATNGETYFAQSEGILEMYKSSINETDDDHVRLIKGRKKKLDNTYVNSDEKTIKIPDIVNGPTTGIQLDIVKSPKFFIEQHKQFKFSHNGYDRLNDRPTYILDFSPRDTSKRTLQAHEQDFYTGKIYIDTASFALVRAEFDLSRRGKNVVNLELDRDKLPLRLNKRTYVIDYAQFNDKWYFKSATVVNNYTLDRELELTNRLEAFVTRIETEKVKKFSDSKDIKELESLGNTITSFDDSFWEDYNFIKSANLAANEPDADAVSASSIKILSTTEQEVKTPLILDYQQNKQVIFFKGGLKQAMKLAAAQKKFIFVDVYTTWCAPCKKMADEVFKDEEIAELMNTFFINIQVDAERNGRDIALKYGVEAYPTTLIIDSTGAVIQNNRGYSGINSFLTQIENTLEFMPNGAVYIATKEAYLKHRKEYNYLLTFAILRRQLGMSNEVMTDALIKSLPLDSLQQLHYQQFITTYANAPDGTTFEFILKNRQLLLFEHKLKSIVQKNVNLAIQKKDKNLLKRALEANASILNSPAVSDEKNAQMTLKYNEEINDFKDYHATAVDILTRYYVPQLGNTNDSIVKDYRAKIQEIGRHYVASIKNKKCLQDIADLVNAACEKHESAELLSLSGQLFYRLNEVNKAKELLNKALKMSKNAKEIADVLDSMNRGVF
jgi:thiol-disulfide isomerase/thioredoxin